MIYRILVKGKISPRRYDEYTGFSINSDDKGNTLLTGPISDQAALHGLLKKFRDSGITLISVNPIQGVNRRDGGESKRCPEKDCFIIV